MNIRLRLKRKRKWILNIRFSAVIRPFQEHHNPIHWNWNQHWILTYLAFWSLKIGPFWPKLSLIKTMTIFVPKFCQKILPNSAKCRPNLVKIRQKIRPKEKRIEKWKSVFRFKGKQIVNSKIRFLLVRNIFYFTKVRFGHIF